MVIRFTRKTFHSNLFDAYFYKRVLRCMLCKLYRGYMHEIELVKKLLLLKEN